MAAQAVVFPFDTIRKRIMNDGIDGRPRLYRYEARCDAVVPLYFEQSNARITCDVKNLLHTSFHIHSFCTVLYINICICAYILLFTTCTHTVWIVCLSAASFPSCVIWTSPCHCSSLYSRLSTPIKSIFLFQCLLPLLFAAPLGVVSMLFGGRKASMRCITESGQRRSAVSQRGRFNSAAMSS